MEGKTDTPGLQDAGDSQASIPLGISASLEGISKLDCFLGVAGERPQQRTQLKIFYATGQTIPHECTTGGSPTSWECAAR